MPARPDLLLPLAVFAGGLAGAVAVMIWTDPEIIDSRWPHLMRLAILWVAGALASLAVWRSRS